MWPDGAVVGGVGDFVAGRMQTYHAEVRGDMVSPEHSWP